MVGSDADTYSCVYTVHNTVLHLVQDLLAVSFSLQGVLHSCHNCQAMRLLLQMLADYPKSWSATAASGLQQQSASASGQDALPGSSTGEPCNAAGKAVVGKAVAAPCPMYEAGRPISPPPGFSNLRTQAPKPVQALRHKAKPDIYRVSCHRLLLLSVFHVHFLDSCWGTSVGQSAASLGQYILPHMLPDSTMPLHEIMLCFSGCR